MTKELKQNLINHLANCINHDLIDDNVADFAEVCNDMICLYAKKNHDYGNAFGEIIEQVGLSYGVGKLKEKLKRVESLLKSDAEVDESIDDSLIDLACYTVMTIVYRKINN